MKFIEISEGVSIRIDEIEAIGIGETEMTSMVYTHHNAYKSTFPYNVLLDLLEGELKEPVDETQQKQLNILKELGTFAG